MKRDIEGEKKRERKKKRERVEHKMDERNKVISLIRLQRDLNTNILTLPIRTNKTLDN